MNRFIASLVIVTVAAMGLGQAGKPASSPASAAASSPATASAVAPAGPAASPEAAWAAVLSAMQAGDKRALAEAVTPKGYKSLMGEKDTLSADDMRSRGKAWAALPVRLSSKTDDEAAASMGAGPSLHGLQFRNTPAG